MKVLQVMPVIAQRYGGPSTVIRSLCRELIRIPGLQLELATTDADGPGGKLDASQIPTEFPVHVFPRQFSERWQYSTALQRWLRGNVGRFDVVHTHALWTYAPGVAAREARRQGVPYIVRPAGMLSDYTIGHGHWAKQIYWRLLERHTIAGACAFHATSEAEASDIRKYRSDAKVFTIPNGVDSDAWTCVVDRDRLRRQIVTRDTDIAIVLFLSRLHPKKGLTDRLLPAIANLEKRVVLAVVGGGDDRATDYLTSVQRRIEDLALCNRVKLLGPVSPAQRWAMYDGADVFVLPSHAENFGIVVAEAMARGCPVVVTDAVQSCTHVRTSGAGEVVTGDVSELTAALDRIVAEPERRRAYGEAGRRYACEQLRWDRIATQVHQMYCDCVSAC